MRSRHQLKLCASVMMLSLMGAGSALAADKTIRAVMSSSVRSLDPVFTSQYATRTAAYMVYDMLFALDSKDQYKPQMVDKYEVSADKLTWTFRLRDGLTFHDGTPVTAADCVASIKRWAKRDNLGQGLIAATASLDIVDEKTFVLKLAKPFGLVIEALGKPSTPLPVIMPARLANTDAFKGVTEVVGSGPFKLKTDEWVPGSKIVFLKNPAYRPRSEPADGFAGGKVVKIDRVEFVDVPDSYTAVSALQKGEVDFVQLQSLDVLSRLRADSSVKVDDGPSLAAFQGVFRPNASQPPFDNPKIRKVLEVALSQKEILAALGVPANVAPCYALFMCGGPYASDAGIDAAKSPNIETAKRMLAESGYKGEKVVLLHSSDVATIDITATVVAATLRKVGFNVEDQMMDFPTLLQRRNNKQPVDKGGWSGWTISTQGYDLSNPLTNFYTAYNCKSFPGWSCDEQTSALLEKFAATSDSAEQKALAAKIQERVYETVPYVPLGQYATPSVYRASLKGFISTGIPLFWNVEP